MISRELLLQPLNKGFRGPQGPIGVTFDASGSKALPLMTQSQSLESDLHASKSILARDLA